MASPHPPGDMPGFETLCAHWGEDPARYQGAVIPPIYQNSLFTFPSSEAWEGISHGDLADEEQVYAYTRSSNPTTTIAEAKIAALERGQKARGFASGMGAISAAILSCIRAGAHVVAPDSVYGPARRFLADYLTRFGIEVSFVDGRDPAEFAAAARPSTTLFYLESPSSLVYKQQDLTAVAAIARQRGIATICDNSWASPYFQNPLEYGVDLVVHSATKYLGGHSDIVAGVVAGSAERIDALSAQEGSLLGATLDPFAAWLLLRGLRTLPLRMERHQENTRRITCALQEHPAVAAVFYPGLSSDSQADLTRRQLRGTSGLFTLRLRQSGRDAAYRFVNALRYFGIGCSWAASRAWPCPSPSRPPRWASRETNRAGSSACTSAWKPPTISGTT
ncbi:MAG TPA: PLP-dependent aspartate aminotransferase family protein [Chthonomonadaceae bacterium]|nr:PLP-dependent aspartate aminotransferase family protein [Chthonomonadaceae bacterium]